MKRLTLLSGIALLVASPLHAQHPDITRLGFLDGCWSGAAAGFAQSFDFSKLRSDSAGVVLMLDQPWRLVRASGDSAVFASAAGTITYYRDQGGLGVAVDSAGAMRTARFSAASCPRRPTMIAGMPGQASREAPGSGATELMVFETLHGLFLGIAVPVMLDAEDPAPYGLGLLLGGPTGLFLSRAWAQRHHPTTGQARAIVWGGTWGALSSLFLYQGVEDFPSASGSMGAMTAGMLGGTLFGGFVARRPISGGDGTLAIHSTFWGASLALMLGILSDEDGEAWMPLLIGGNAGLLAGAMAARKVEMSSGRVWLITASGLAGLVGGIGIDILAQTDDEQTAVLIPLVTTLAGLALGTRATRDFDRGRLALREGPPTQALLAMRDGRLRLGVPLPQPALVPNDDGRARRWTPGLRVPIFSLR